MAHFKKNNCYSKLFKTLSGSFLKKGDCENSASKFNNVTFLEKVKKVFEPNLFLIFGAYHLNFFYLLSSELPENLNQKLETRNSFFLILVSCEKFEPIYVIIQLQFGSFLWIVLINFQINHKYICTWVTNWLWVFYF